MLRFGAAPTQGSDSLRTLEQALDIREFERLRHEGGFTPPNDFPIDALVSVLQDHAFPSSDLYEYQWAIQECGFERLATYSTWIKLYLAAVYSYCNKQHAWGLQIDSDYYYLVIVALRDEPQHEAIAAFLAFFEWLADHVPPAAGYEDYYGLLAWTLLRRLSSDADHPSFRAVIDRLLAKNYGRADVELLSASERDIDTWWHELHEKIPCPPELELTFALIMCQ